MRLDYLTVRTRSAEETMSVARALGRIALPGQVVLLIGDLGTGKTTFVQGFARGLDISELPTSPTFTMVHTYDGRLPLLHVDLYRCETTSDVIGLGLDEMFEPPWVSVVEWGERAGSIVPDDNLEIELMYDAASEEARQLAFRPFGRWRNQIRQLTEVLNHPEG